LTRSPEQYTVREILQLTEDSLAPVACLNEAPMQCARAAECKNSVHVERLYTVIQDYFEGITFADLAWPREDGNEFVI
jgi:DNA-binding IscR family transcriptional regulator